MGALIKKPKDLGLITGVEACRDLIHFYTLGRDCDLEMNFEMFSGSFVDISVSMWDPEVEKFEKKSSSWKMQYLSFGGRITLIKSSLSSLPVYYKSLYRMPMVVTKKLDWIRRNFLWDGNCVRRKMHLVK